MQSQTLSRRSFVAGAAASAAAAAAACAPAAARASEPAWTHEADVVIVGLGGAGAAAAVSALDAGASVAILESEAQGGGCTAVCGGLVYMGGGTKTQIDAGVEDTVEDMRAYLLAAMGASADPELVDVLCNASVDLYDWLVDAGVTFEGGADLVGHVVTAPQGVVLTYSGNERAPHYAAVAKVAPRGHTPNGGGAAIMEALTARIEASDAATVLCNTRATELVRDERGVAGVKALAEDGSELLVKAAKGVVLATGAFSYNDALLADHAPEALLCAGRTGMPSDRGDGILMGLQAGAALRSMSRLNISEFMYQYGDLAFGVMVNGDGLRFLSEDWYGSWVGDRVARLASDACYIVVDDTMMQAALQTPFGARLVPVFEAPTLEELADQMPVPSQNLLDSVERYNAHCAQGEDADFGKDPLYLKPVQTAPFYAVDTTLALAWVHTLGGLKIDAQARVLDLAGDPIPGLYAAGRTSCGVFGDYPASGTSVADCLTFGRIAGAQAASC